MKSENKTYTKSVPISLKLKPQIELAKDVIDLKQQIYILTLQLKHYRDMEDKITKLVTEDITDITDILNLFSSYRVTTIDEALKKERLRMQQILQTINELKRVI